MCSYRRSLKFCPGANFEPFVTLEMKLRPVESGGDDLRNAISSPNQVLAGDPGKTGERKPLWNPVDITPDMYRPKQIVLGSSRASQTASGHSPPPKYGLGELLRQKPWRKRDIFLVNTRPF